MKEEATAHDWYNSSVDPRSAVSEYMAAPPKGMTSHPQSRKVRKLLLRDLKEMGVQLEHPNWPPPMPESLRPDVEAFDGPSRSHSSPAASRDINPKRGPHLHVVRQGAFGDVVEPSPRLPQDPDGEPKRLWKEAPKTKKNYHRKRDDAHQSAGFPSAIWRPTRISMEDSSLAGRSANATRKAAPTPSSAKHTAPSQLVLARALSEGELYQARYTLKGQAALHTAAVSDRFRFAADMSAGAPAVIKGAGVASGMNSNSWASDASALINFHHRHIRMIAKSGLDTVKEQPTKKKKKKDDIDHLQLSDSGLFQPKYPIDSSLLSLRRLKISMFPESVKKEQEDADHLAAMGRIVEQEILHQQMSGLRSGRYSTTPV